MTRAVPLPQLEIALRTSAIAALAVSAFAVAACGGPVAPASQTAAVSPLPPATPGMHRILIEERVSGDDSVGGSDLDSIGTDEEGNMVIDFVSALDHAEKDATGASLTRIATRNVHLSCAAHSVWFSKVQLYTAAGALYATAPDAPGAHSTLPSAQMPRGEAALCNGVGDPSKIVMAPSAVAWAVTYLSEHGK